MRKWHLALAPAALLALTTVANAGLIGSTFGVTMGSTGGVTVTANPTGNTYTAGTDGPSFCIGPNEDNCTHSGLFGNVSVSDSQITVSFSGGSFGQAGGSFTLDLNNFLVPIESVQLNSSTPLGEGTFGLTTSSDSDILFTGTTPDFFDGTNQASYVFDVTSGSAAPEPASVGMILFGFAGIGIPALRKRKARA